jgi:hypothetical protein
VTIDEQRVGDVARDHGQVVILEVVQVVNDVDSSPAAQVRWLHYPQIFFGLFLLEEVKV